MKLKKITRKTAKQYKQDPFCPFCKDPDNLSWGDLEIEQESVYQEVTCGTCDREHTSIYRFVGLTFGEDQDPVYVPAKGARDV